MNWKHCCVVGLAVVWEISEKYLRSHSFFMDLSWVPWLRVCVCVHRGEKLSYDKVEKQMATSEPSRAPGGESDGRHSGSTTPISILPPAVLFCFFLHATYTIEASANAFIGGYSSKVDEHSFAIAEHTFGEEQVWKDGYAYATGGESTWMNAPLLCCPIFPFSFSGGWCQDRCEFSHPRDVSYTHRLYIRTPEEPKKKEVEEEEAEEGEENRTRRWKAERRLRGGTAYVWIDWQRSRRGDGDARHSDDEQTEVMQAAHSCTYSEYASIFGAKVP